MHAWSSKICVLVLAMALMPGALELLENTAHLLTMGHLAHAAAHGDRHTPTGPEHGCTPIFHSCGCHSGLAFLVSSAPPAASLLVTYFARPDHRGAQRTGFSPPLDRPPQT